MKHNQFEVIREGVHTTFQDHGYFNVQHLGITTGGVADIDLFILANKIINNKYNTPALEFSLQGPKLKLTKGKCRFVITGNVNFNILQGEKITNGIPHFSYKLQEGDVLDILSTINSNYGYLAVEGGFVLDNLYGCSSTLVQSGIGPNEGKKLSSNQIIKFFANGSNAQSSLNTDDSKIFCEFDNIIRVLKGPQMNFFMQKTINKFYSQPFQISNKTNRTGIRVEGNSIISIKPHNINSEGIIKGSVQVPGDGNPIILMTEHPSIGGYPKIATVILADFAKLVQYPSNTNFFFKEVTLVEAENIYVERNKHIKSQLKKIIHN